MIKAKAQFTRPQFSYDPASAMEEPKLSDITIGIKTFSRPDLLKFTLGKLREDYDSSVRIIVADDSKDDHKRENERIIGEFINVDHVTLPFDSGISVGRNALVVATRTRFFLLFCMSILNKGTEAGWFRNLPRASNFQGFSAPWVDACSKIFQLRLSETV